MKVLMLALMGVAIITSAAQAQTGKHVALGVGLGFHEYVDNGFSQKSPALSLIYRLALNPRMSEGWIFEPKGTLNWFKTDVQADVGGVDTHIGKLRSIPVLVGGGPSYRHGRTKIGVAILAGRAFNQFTVDNSVSSMTVKNSLVVSPEASLWYDIGSRLGLYGGLSYVYNRPTAETTSGGSTTSAKWNTDHLNFSVGFAFGIF
jgi:hypothetical protein